MKQFSIEEHLESMLGDKPETWLVDLASMLQELGDLDSALAASRAFDLSRNKSAAQGLKDLISGYHTISQELKNSKLTNNQIHTIQSSLHTLGRNIMGLSKLQIGNEIYSQSNEQGDMKS